MAKSDMSLEDRISKAKTKLILEHPFVGTIALTMPFVITREGPMALTPTAATDGVRVYMHPDFCDKLTDEQLLFLVAHECFHPMLEHLTRRQERDPMKWNMAADFVINQLLVDEKIGEFIPGGCLDKKLYDKGGALSESIYDLLPDMPNMKFLGQGQGSGKDEQGQGKGQQGQSNGGSYNGQQPYDGMLDPPGQTAAERSQFEQEWKVRTAQAAQAAKMMGKLSANMARLVDEVLKPRVNWREVLRKFVQKAKNDTRSWARPNRRFLSQGLIMPTISGESLGEICIAIDCSGSIGQHELNIFAAEIRGIKEEGRPTAMHLLYFDSEVCHYERFGKDDDLHVEPHGGGGTDFAPVFRMIDDKSIEPVCCIFLTDLCCNSYADHTPGFPVLWVSTMDHGENGYGKPPFGETVVMRDTV